MPKSLLTERATSAKSDLWGSPRALAERLVQEFELSHDAAACRMTAVCGGDRYFGPDHEELTWRDALMVERWPARCWINPPFSMLGQFCAKAANEAVMHGVLTVALLPANKWEQAWAHATIPLATEVRLLKGRVTYLEPEVVVPMRTAAEVNLELNPPYYLLNGTYTANAPALFPSCVVVWDGTKPAMTGSGPKWSFWSWR